jgi:hypothetical protein
MKSGIDYLPQTVQCWFISRCQMHTLRGRYESFLGYLGGILDSDHKLVKFSASYK